LNLLKHKGVLTQEEIEGIASEAFDAREWDKEKLEQRYQERLTEIDAQIKKLEMRVKEIDDSEKQK
jgi:hypothetical protein